MSKYKKSLDLAAAREDRRIAKLCGAISFQGRACKKCGERERYVSNGGCIACANPRMNLSEIGMRSEAGEARKAAARVGATTYDCRYPCKRCGTSMRYTSSGGCVECIKKRVSIVREQRAAVFHSDTSPVMWINEPPPPEVAHFYAMCPTLAAYAGQWHVVYTDAKHLSGGLRLYPGCDVLARPAALQAMLNDKTNPGHEIARHLIPAYYPAMRAFNLRER